MFPGLHTIWFLITYSVQKQKRKVWEEEGLGAEEGLGGGRFGRRKVWEEEGLGGGRFGS